MSLDLVTLPIPGGNKYYHHQRWGVEAERNPYKQTLLGLLLSPFSIPIYFSKLFHNCYSLFNLVYEHLGLSAFLALPFPLVAPMYMQKSICLSPLILSYVNLILRTSRDPKRVEIKLCLPYNDLRLFTKPSHARFR